jgi:hypothetical protein
VKKLVYLQRSKHNRLIFFFNCLMPSITVVFTNVKVSLSFFAFDHRQNRFFSHQNLLAAFLTSENETLKHRDENENVRHFFNIKGGNHTLMSSHQLIPSHQMPCITPLASSSFFSRNWTARTRSKTFGKYRVCLATKKLTGTKTKNAPTYRDLLLI